MASGLSTDQAYSPDIANRKAQENLKAKGPDLKLGHDFTLVKDISRLIKQNRYSPAAMIMHYQENGWPSDTRISISTLYRYLTEG